MKKSNEKKRKEKKKFKKNSAIMGFEPPPPSAKSSPLTKRYLSNRSNGAFITILILRVIINTPAPPVFNNVP